MKLLIKLLKNKYLIVILVFLLFIIVIDDTSLVMSFQLRSQLKELEKTKEFYQNEITQDSLRIKALRYDMKAIEQYAREEFFMKKDNEDLFIVKLKSEE